MTPLFGQDEAVSRFVAENIDGCGRGFGKSKAIGVRRTDGSLVAGVVYHNWSPEAGVIEMSAASVDRRWLNRAILSTIFTYPFEQVGCQCVVLRVSANSRQKHLHRILKAYGFNGYRIPRLRGRDEDEIVFTLTVEDWRNNRFHRENVLKETG